MEIKFVGTGGAFQVESGNSSALLIHKEKTLLIDCGHAVFPKLVRKNLIEKIDAVLITHFHDDHVGSLSSLILYYKLAFKKGKLKILIPGKKFGEELKKLLSFSLGNPEDWVQFEVLQNWPGISAWDTKNLHVNGMMTWAYCFQEKEQTLVYSGDLGDSDYIFKKCASLKIQQPVIFHEVCFEDYGKAHSFYKRLDRHADKYDIFGYHCDHKEAPADLKINLVANYPEYLI